MSAGHVHTLQAYAITATTDANKLISPRLQLGPLLPVVGMCPPVHGCLPLGKGQLPNAALAWRLHLNHTVSHQRRAGQPVCDHTPTA